MGRGASENIPNRFADIHVVTDTEEVSFNSDEASLNRISPSGTPALKTHVVEIVAKSIITRNRSPDVPFEQSINVYQGCEHGCAYCYARASHSYLGLSPGLEFETRLFAKTNALEVLKQELAKPSYKCKPISLGNNTDAYQPIERSYTLTRAIAELLMECKHPLSIVTKSSLVERDLDLYSEMAEQDLVDISISLTTLDKKLAKQMEPRASSPDSRLRSIERIANAGIPVGVLVAPIIPGLNDHEIESILSEVKNCGGSVAGYVVLRLPHEVKEVFKQWLGEYHSDKKNKIMSHVRSLHGGQEYEATFNKRMRGVGPIADLVEQRFRVCAQRLGLHGRSSNLRTDLFIPPSSDHSQLNLF